MENLMYVLVEKEVKWCYRKGKFEEIKWNILDWMDFKTQTHHH